MTTTEAYSRTHHALACAARENGLTPTDVRVLVALHDRGGEGRTGELYEEMFDEGTMIRRASLALRKRRFIAVRAADGSPRPKRGVQAVYRLTARGETVALRVRAILDAIAPA